MITLSFSRIPKIILASSLLFLILLVNSAVFAGDTPPHVANQIIVKLDPLTAVTIDEINADYGTTTLTQLTPLIYLLQTPPGTEPEDLLDALELDGRIAYAELNYIGETPENSGQNSWAWGGQDEAPMAGQYALAALNLPQAHMTSQGDGVIVAVLDTGVQRNHPALAGSFTAVAADFIDGDNQPDDIFDGLDNDGDDLIDEAAGHGTHVAGIIHLTAPQAQIMPIRVLNSDGQGNIYSLAEAINFAAANGADVINLSLGLPKKSALLKDVIRQAARQGVVVIAAAGNTGSKSKQYPAASQCALAVTAVGPDATLTDFAAFGSWVAFAAPGQSIYSTFPESGYAWWSGTSMAAPFVAAQAALLLSVDPSLTVRDVALLIAHTAQPLSGPDQINGGLPDAQASLQRLLSGDIPTANHGLISSSCISGG